MTGPTRVLIVDDSASARLGLRRLLESSGTFVVVGEAASRAEAIELATDLRPDLVTMDVYLGGDDGLVTTREILSAAPVPIVIVTGLATERMELAFRATEVGAIDGVVSAEDVTGPYDVIARAEANSVDELGKMVVSRVQMIDGITRTLTCPVVHL